MDKIDQRWEQAKEPKNKIALRAFEEIQMIKIRRMNKETKERQQEVKIKQKREKMQEAATIDVAMRSLILEREAVKRKERVREMLGGEIKIE